MEVNDRAAALAAMMSGKVRKGLDGLDSSSVQEIDVRLARIERDEGVTILHAVESGSRAWGFPSPDSDYDARFLYLRRARDYLRLQPFRDVIEVPLDGILDVNGWDLHKALRLLLKSNAVVVEWLQSPLVYQGIDGFAAAMLDLAGAVVERPALARHYLRLGGAMRDRVIGQTGEVPLKKLFYVLRPAIALRWMRISTREGLPPMNFRELCAESDLPQDLRGAIDRLLSLKAQTRELGSGPVPEPIGRLIATELDGADWIGAHAAAPTEERREMADRFFLDCIKHYDSAGTDTLIALL